MLGVKNFIQSEFSSMTADFKAMAIWRYSVFRLLSPLIKDTKLIVYSVVLHYLSAETKGEWQTTT